MEKFDRARAIIDLVMMAAHKPTSKIVRGKIVHLKRAQLCASCRFLGERWGWDKDSAQRFLKKLNESELIILHKKPDATQNATVNINIITICNYDSYDYSKTLKKRKSATEMGTPMGTETGTPLGTGLGTPVGTEIGTPMGTNTIQYDTERWEQKFSLSDLEEFEAAIFSEFKTKYPKYVPTPKDKKKIEPLLNALIARWKKINPSHEYTLDLLVSGWRHFLKHMDPYYQDKPMHIIIDNIDEIANKVGAQEVLNQQ